MAVLRPALILVEAAFCFGTPVLGLMLGLMFWPALLKVESSAWGIFGLLFALAGGCIGAFSLFVLLRKILNPAARLPPVRIVWVSLLFGVGALVVAALYILDRNTRLFTLGLPLLATMHFVYLGRDVLFSSRANQTMEPTR